MLCIKIAYLSDDARKPTQATDQSCGWDLYALKNGEVWPGTRKLIPLGFAIELPEGWQAKIKQRSSMFLKGLITNDSPIDSDYRGPVSVLVNNTSADTWVYKRGERIGQLLFEPVPVIRWVRVEQEELTDTFRGAGGWGSTGK